MASRARGLPITLWYNCGQWRQSRHVYCNALHLALTVRLESEALASAMAINVLRASVSTSLDDSSEPPVWQSKDAM